MSNALERLKQAKLMLDGGLISQEEFEQLRTQILQEMTNVTSPPKSGAQYMGMQTYTDQEENIGAAIESDTMIHIPTSPKRKRRKSISKNKKGIRFFGSKPTTQEPEKIALLQGPKMQTFSLNWSGDDSLRMLCTVGKQFSLGSNAQISDQQLIFEPIAPAHLYANNIHRSQRISRTHLIIKNEDDSLILQSNGSNGTTVQHQNLRKGSQCPLPSGVSVSVANDLVLTTQVHTENDRIHGVQLLRVNNRQQKSHLLICDDLGLWEDEEWLIGPQEDAPAVLMIKDNEICLFNRNAEDVQIEGTALEKGKYTPIYGEKVLLSLFGKLFLFQRLK